MVKHMLRRAICCAGVALLPPSFDGMPDAGASCFDFRGRQPAIDGSLLLNSSCSSSSTNAASWWSKMPKQTPANCDAPSDADTLTRLVSSLHAGFGLPGPRALGTDCPTHVLRPDTLVMHIRSGDLFTTWRDGARTFNHTGYNSDMSSRGQPPLGFYLQAMAHALPPPPQPAGTVLLVTSPDIANPVVKALTYQARLGAFRHRLNVSASATFRDDLLLLLCARNLVLAASSLTELFVDSPRLERTYSFAGNCTHRAGVPICKSAPAWCTNHSSCAPGHEVSRMCLQPHTSYSPLANWLNSDAQQVEMLLGGDASVPVVDCKTK